MGNTPPIPKAEPGHSIVPGKWLLDPDIEITCPKCGDKMNKFNETYRTARFTGIETKAMCINCMVMHGASRATFSDPTPPSPAC
eukprot:g69701.t1